MFMFASRSDSSSKKFTLIGFGNSLAIKVSTEFKLNGSKSSGSSLVSQRAKNPVSVPVKSKLVCTSNGTMVGQPVESSTIRT